MSVELSVRPRSEIGPERWDAFADASDEAWLWHSWDLIEALRTWPASTDHSFAVVDDSDQPLALMPLRSTRTTLVRAIQASNLESLGGPAIANGEGRRRRAAVGEAIVAEILRVGSASRATEARLTPSPLAPAYRGASTRAINPLLELGGEPLPSQTWILDVPDEPDAAWEGMEGRARTAVRKAEGAGVVVRDAGPDDLDAYYELHRSTYGRTEQPPHPRAYFEAIWSDFLGKGRAIVLIAELDGRPIAAQSFAIFKDAAAYWTGASNDEGLKQGANNLLQWHALRRFCETSVDYYEAGEAFPASADAKLRGLSEFKRSTGGTLRPLHRMRFDLAEGGVDVALRLRDLMRSVRRLPHGRAKGTGAAGR